MLNTKYILIPKPENLSDFLSRINKDYYKLVRNVIISDNYNDADLKNTTFNNVTKEYVFNADEGMETYCMFDLNSDAACDYLISFEICEQELLSKDVVVGLYNGSEDSIEVGEIKGFYINSLNPSSNFTKGL